MRCLPFFLALSVALPMYAAKQASHLMAPPAGATLPVILSKTIQPNGLTSGRSVTARLAQRVPVSVDSYLSPKTELVGKIVAASPSRVEILFAELRWRGQTVPVHVRLLAAASRSTVFNAGMPLGGTDRGTSNPADWTIRQVGGDEVYRSAGSGTVYNRFSQPVGHADLHGVYGDPLSKGQLPRAMGPFSTTATGLHGLEDFSIASAGGPDSPITLTANRPTWKILSGTAMLLEVVP